MAISDKKSTQADEPLYDSIRERSASPDLTPTQSPVATPRRRASDTISTGSSTDGGGDLMKEILKEMKPTSGADPQEESIYSTLVRKGKKKRHQKSASVED